MAEQPNKGHNRIVPKAARGVIEGIESLQDQQAKISEDIAQIKKDASEEHGISTQSINRIIQERQQIRKRGQLSFNDFWDECDVLREALKESSIASPDPEHASTVESKVGA